MGYDYLCLFLFHSYARPLFLWLPLTLLAAVERFHPVDLSDPRRAGGGIDIRPALIDPFPRGVGVGG